MESMKERKESICMKPHIDLQGILQRREGKKNSQGELPFSIDVKGGEKEQKKQRNIISMKTGAEMVTGRV
jgi:hypothetical protein